MTAGTKAKTTLTDAERHKRFVEMAREVEASEDPKDFEKAFERVTEPKRLSKPTQKERQR